MAELSTDTISAIADAVVDATSKLDPAGALGSPTDIWVLIALIIPGFITFRIIIWVTGIEVKFDQFTMTIYSLILSLGVYVPVGIVNGFTTIDIIRQKATDPVVIGELVVFAITCGCVAGFILKKVKFKHHFAGTAWDRFGKEHLREYVAVYTISDQPNYVGWIKRISTGKDDKREITLGEPQVIKEVDGERKLVDVGEEMYISEASIARILKMFPQ